MYAFIRSDAHAGRTCRRPAPHQRASQCTLRRLALVQDLAGVCTLQQACHLSVEMESLDLELLNANGDGFKIAMFLVLQLIQGDALLQLAMFLVLQHCSIIQVLVVRVCQGLRGDDASMHLFLELPGKVLVKVGFEPRKNVCSTVASKLQCTLRRLALVQDLAGGRTLQQACH
jgi:hypothetical protein